MGNEPIAAPWSRSPDGGRPEYDGVPQGPSPGASTWLRRYGSYRGVALDVVLAVTIQFILSIVVIVACGTVSQLSGHSFANGVQWLQSSPLALPIAVLLTDGGILLLLWYRAAHDHLGWSVFGLDDAQLRRGAGAAVTLGVAAGLGLLVISTLLGNLLERLGLNQSGQYNEMIVPLQRAPAWVIVVFILLGTFLAPAVEECFFRGYIFRALRSRKPAFWAYLLSAATFGAVHLLPAQFPVFFVSGLVLAFVYDRTQNMLANMTTHATNNGIALVLSLLPTLLHHH